MCPTKRAADKRGHLPTLLGILVQTTDSACGGWKGSLPAGHIPPQLKNNHQLGPFSRIEDEVHLFQCKQLQGLFLAIF
jgi:hypothetical protein